MDNLIPATEVALQLAKMDIGQLLLARQATKNPKFQKILDMAIDAKLPKNNP